MSTFIYIPRDGISTNLSESDQDAALSPLTYKMADIDGPVEFNESGYICAFGSGAELLQGGATSSLAGIDSNAWVSDEEGDTATLSGTVSNLALCDRYEFDNLENSNWTPAEFGEDVEYHNNMSESGQFIGRTIVRRARNVSVAPLSFDAPIERLQEVLAIKNAMRNQPFYVSTLAPHGARYVFYGWTNKEPTVEYLTDYGQVSLSFEMRGVA